MLMVSLFSQAASRAFNNCMINGRRLRIMWGRSQAQQSGEAGQHGGVQLAPVPNLPMPGGMPPPHPHMMQYPGPPAGAPPPPPGTTETDHAQQPLFTETALLFVCLVTASPCSKAVISVLADYNIMTLTGMPPGPPRGPPPTGAIRPPGPPPGAPPRPRAPVHYPSQVCVVFRFCFHKQTHLWRTYLMKRSSRSLSIAAPCDVRL
jgi:hypothetical protein